LVGGWAWGKVGGRGTWTSETHLRGTVNWVGTELGHPAPEPAAWGGMEPVRLRDVPPPLRGLRIIRATVEDSRRAIGLIPAERAHTWTGILAVRSEEHT